jgi:hypothetical protein
MLRFLADENFDGRITAGLRQREPTLDFVRVQDVGLSGIDDPTILAWALPKNVCCLRTIVRRFLDSPFNES